jgi:hypothetical protein
MTSIKIVQLSKDLIIAASLEILGNYGLADMTMRRVATQLSVAPGALYWHFKNKDALIDATVRTVLADFLAPDPQSRYDDLSAACTHMRQLMLSLRDGAELVSAALTNPEFRTAILDVLNSTLPESAPSAGSATALHFVVGATVFEQTEHLRLITSTESDSTSAETAHKHADELFDEGLNIIVTGLSGI